MTRTKNSGINEFPLSVDFFDNPKICAVTVEHGIKGQAAAIMLLCAIYRNGYFIEWTPENYITILKELPGIKVKKMQKIVETLVEWGFFDRSLFEKHQVLTSREIQQHFCKSTGNGHQTAVGSLPYWLADEGNDEDITQDTKIDIFSLDSTELKKMAAEKIKEYNEKIGKHDNLSCKYKGTDGKGFG